MLERIKKVFRQIRGLLPSELPNGASAFDAWVDSIVNTYSLPTSDIDSIKFTLATIIMHLGPTVAYRSKFYFVLVLKASAAKQVAHNAFGEIKQKQQAAQAAAAAKPVEAVVESSNASQG
jgi:hypothetical protein